MMRKFGVLLDRFPSFIVLAYALFFGVLLNVALADNNQLGYSSFYNFLYAIGHLFVLIAIVCFGLRFKNTQLQCALRRIFPFSLLMFLSGIVLDAVVPADYSLLVTGFPWLFNAIPMLLAVSPAYVIHYHYSHPNKI